MRSAYGAKMTIKEGRGSEAPVVAVQYQPDYSIGRTTPCPKAWADQMTARMMVGSDSHQFATLASLSLPTGVVRALAGLFRRRLEILMRARGNLTAPPSPDEPQPVRSARPKKVLGALRPRQREPLQPALQDSSRARGGETVLVAMWTGQEVARTREARIRINTYLRRSHLLRWRCHQLHPAWWPGI